MRGEVDWLWLPGPALLAVAIAAFGAWLAWWQVRVAKEKLRHDLFDRRIAVYTAFHDLMLAVGQATIDLPEPLAAVLLKANLIRPQGRFLLDEGLSNVLETLFMEAFRIKTEGDLLREQRFAIDPKEWNDRFQFLASDRLRYLDNITLLSAAFEKHLKLRDFN